MTPFPPLILRVRFESHDHFVLGPSRWLTVSTCSLSWTTVTWDRVRFLGEGCACYVVTRWVTLHQNHMVSVICWAHFSFFPFSHCLFINTYMRPFVSFWLWQSTRLRMGESTEMQISSCFILASQRRLVCSEGEVYWTYYAAHNGGHCFRVMLMSQKSLCRRGQIFLCCWSFKWLIVWWKMFFWSTNIIQKLWINE